MLLETANDGFVDERELVPCKTLHQLGDSGARSKLTNAYFDSRLSTTGTARNWRTVGKLFAMVEETGQGV